MTPLKKLMASIVELEFEVQGLEGEVDTDGFEKILKDMKSVVRELKK